jgi:sugar phosphate permease
MTSAQPQPTPAPTVHARRAWLFLATLVLGYIGVYLCRKNFSVAVPLIREAFGVSKEQIGIVASVSTLAYMAGKFAFGPLIDRFGGRGSLLLSMLAVGVFAAAGGLAGSLPMLATIYSLNRLSGSAGWGAMVKLVPDWFGARQLPLALAVLSLSFVFGGVCAAVLAGQIAGWSGDDWRWVMSGPSLALAAILALCWAVLPRPSNRTAAAGAGSRPMNEPPASAHGFQWRQVLELGRRRQFWVVCALSFTLTLLRETFNTWTVDFFKEAGGAELSNRIAAFL